MEGEKFLTMLRGKTVRMMGLLASLMVVTALALRFPGIPNFPRDGVVVTAIYLKMFGLPASIVPVSRRFWTPGRDVIVEAESRLIPFLQRETTSTKTEDFSNTLTGILAGFKYQRTQYAGVMIGHKKVILLNFVGPERWRAPGIGKEAFFWHWRYINARHGGSYFWNVLYDVNSGTFSDLSYQESF